MATAGIIQRKDTKSALIAGQPTPSSGADWSGPVVEGEIVYATDTKEIGFLDSTGNLKWVSVDDLGVSNIEDLKNVSIINPVINDVLQFDGTQWTTGQIDVVVSLSQLSDVNSALAPVTNDVLQFDGTQWTTGQVNSVSSLSQLSDVNSALAPVTNDVLQFDGTQWTTGQASGEFIKDGVGYRVRGLSTDVLGFNAVNLGEGGSATGSRSFTVGLFNQSSGISAFSTGRNTRSIGDYSFAQGYDTCAIGGCSHAEGIATCAAGYGSHAEGFGSRACGSFSHSSGYVGQAVGNYSVTTGCNTIAKGQASFTTGKETRANADFNMSIGSYNVGRTNTYFEIGIGTSAIDRRNSFESYTDGRLVAPGLSPSLINSPRSLVTKEYVEYTGTTTNRPTTPSPGQFYLDTDLNKPIWYNGTNWIDATGTIV